MIKISQFFLFLCLLFSSIVLAQSETQQAKMDQIVQESGIDPTRNQSTVLYAFLVNTPKNSPIRMFNRFSGSVAVKDWTFTARYDVTSIYLDKNDFQVGGFYTGLGDLRISGQNTFFKKGKHALAAATEVLIPTAKSGYAFYGTSYFAFTPFLSYSVMPILGTLFVIQSKYTFDVLRQPNTPALQLWVTRIFVAQFTRKGYFFVLEPRPIVDFTKKNCNFIMSSIIGKALGKGFNLLAMIELPTSNKFWKETGPTYQLMLNKSFTSKK